MTISSQLPCFNYVLNYHRDSVLLFSSSFSTESESGWVGNMFIFRLHSAVPSKRVEAGGNQCIWRTPRCIWERNSLKGIQGSKKRRETRTDEAHASWHGQETKARELRGGQRKQHTRAVRLYFATRLSLEEEKTGWWVRKSRSIDLSPPPPKCEILGKQTRSSIPRVG